MFILNPFHTLGPPTISHAHYEDLSRIAERRSVVKSSNGLNIPYTVERLRITYHSKYHKLEHDYSAVCNFSCCDGERHWRDKIC